MSNIQDHLKFMSTDNNWKFYVSLVTGFISCLLFIILAIINGYDFFWSLTHAGTISSQEYNKRSKKSRKRNWILFGISLFFGIVSLIFILI